MHKLPKLLVATIMMSLCSLSFAQADSSDEAEELKIAALEALMSAPSERALPIVAKVLSGDGSDELKERALFVLSQIDLPEAQTLLLETAQNGSGELRQEAIRMVGIGGDPEALAGLSAIYASGDEDTREAVLEAYLIADDSDAVYQLAVAAESGEDFDAAVEMLAAMGALEELRSLRDRAGLSEGLIEAYAIAGDVESLQALAMDNSNPELQAQAIEGLGMAGGDEVGAVLTEIYRGSASADVREAALEGLLIADHDDGVLELFRESQDAAEKRELLEMLVMMDSDAVWDIIDSTLEDER